MRSSSKARIAVASPSSVWSRHTKPDAPSASALISSRRPTNPAIWGEVIGASSVAMFT
jgi:hypothetical protein